MPAERSLAQVGGDFFSLPVAASEGVWWRSGALLAVVGAHLLLAAAIGYASLRPEALQPLRALSVRLLEAAPPVPAKVEPPKPPVPKPVPRPVPRRVAEPLPVMVAAAPTDTAASFAVAPQVPAPVAAPPAPPAPMVAARFDADYLQNPKPKYPALSRRLGEEGKVVLRVRVSAQGAALSVVVKQSSGHERLDAAAIAAVERWRFVPARQGEQAVEASVLVPLNFTLSN